MEKNHMNDNIIIAILDACIAIYGEISSIVRDFQLNSELLRVIS